MRVSSPARLTTRALTLRIVVETWMGFVVLVVFVNRAGVERAGELILLLNAREQQLVEEGPSTTLQDLTRQTSRT